GFPIDLEQVVGQMSNDRDDAFIGAVVAATGRGEASIREQLRRSTDAEPWMYLPGDAHQATGMFQIRRNTCSTGGIEAYLARNPALQDVVDEAAAGAALLPGNLPRVCSGLSHFSRARGAEPFTWQQVGDVRFNFLDWINEPQPAGPLGYGPSSVDKENGRILSGNAHIYGAAVDTYARSAADIVRAMNEDLEIGALINGVNYAEWLENNNSVGNMEMALTADVEQGILSRFGDFDVEDAYGSYHLPDGRIDHGELLRQMQRRLTDPVPGDPMNQAMRGGIDEGRERLEALKRDPAFRARFITDQEVALVRPLFGLKPGDKLTPEAEDAAVDLAIDPESFNERQRERFRYFADRNAYLAEFMDDSLIGQALALKGMPADEVFRQLREEIFRGVALHEIGHTLGMTHNFEGSRDALNYQDEFWAIRDVTPENEWAEARLPEYRYSTIMEYGARFNSDTKGLGKYDRAAIKYVYGRNTEHFAPEVPVSSTLGTEVFINGYATIPSQLGGDFHNINKRVDVPIEEHASAKFEGIVENTRKLLEDPTRAPEDYWYDREVPYGYCFDVFRGNINCQTWDEGATYTETVRSAIQNYWNYFVFSNYRRGRAEYGFINGYFSRQDRVSWYLTNFFRYFYFYQQWDIGLRRDLEQAALIGLNFINQVLGTPEPGPHCLDDKLNLYVPYRLAAPEIQANCDPIEVDPGTGRDLLVRYNDDYFYQVDYIGSYFDKVNLMYHLVDTSTSFFRVTNIGDSRAFSIGYYRVFNEELLELIRDMVFTWLGERAGKEYSSYVMADSVTPKVLVAEEAFGQDPDQMEGTPQLYAPVSYNLIWRALALYTVFNTSIDDFQLDFDEYITISERGSGDARTYPADWPVATFVHPQTQTVYEAGQTRDRKSLAFDLLTSAQRFVDTTWRPAYEAAQAAPSNAQAQTEFRAADRRLGQYADLIGDLRSMRAAVDYGRD
ncbi:MAG: zinc-dependent metalloprotease, partial [Myxococcales bacterium]|nr:zinc-dependent metalloprotease [Myxococcales bacterium]